MVSICVRHSPLHALSLLTPSRSDAYFLRRASQPRSFSGMTGGMNARSDRALSARLAVHQAGRPRHRAPGAGTHRAAAIT